MPEIVLADKFAIDLVEQVRMRLQFACGVVAVPGEADAAAAVPSNQMVRMGGRLPIPVP